MQKGECKHYNGSFHNLTCDRGIEYTTVTPNIDAPGKMYREPCRRRMHESEHGLQTIEAYGQPGTCDHYEEPTAEEIADWEREGQEMIMDSLARRGAILGDIADRRISDGVECHGTVKCPICEQELRYARAPNGDLRGSCVGGQCSNFME